MCVCLVATRLFGMLPVGWSMGWLVGAWFGRLSVCIEFLCGGWLSNDWYLGMSVVGWVIGLWFLFDV